MWLDRVSNPGPPALKSDALSTVLCQGCHLSSTSKFNDFSLKFYGFPYPPTDKKKHFYSLL